MTDTGWTVAAIALCSSATSAISYTVLKRQDQRAATRAPASPPPPPGHAAPLVSIAPPPLPVSPER